MKAKKPGKGTRAATRRSKDLAPKKVNAAKGGSRVMASAHEMKKALIANFPR